MVLSAFCEGKDFLPRQRVVPGNYYHTTQNYYTESITCTICRCNVQMREQPRRDVADQVSWWCPQCKTRKTRDGSFFQKSHLTLQKWLLLLYKMRARQYPVTDAAQEAEVDKGTAFDVYQWFREEADGKQQENQLGLQIG